MASEAEKLLSEQRLRADNLRIEAQEAASAAQSALTTFSTTSNYVINQLADVSNDLEIDATPDSAMLTKLEAVETKIDADLTEADADFDELGTALDNGLSTIDAQLESLNLDFPDLEEFQSSVEFPNAPSVVVNNFTKPQEADLADVAPLAPSINVDSILNGIGNEPEILEQLNAITLPEFAALEAIEAPTIITPTFDAVFDADAPSKPTITQDSYQEIYKSFSEELRGSIVAEMDAYIEKHNPEFFSQISLLNQKLADMAEGKLGITPAQENQFLERAKDRNFAEYRRAVETAYKDSARRGFTMPGGAIFSAVNQARQSLADTNARSSNEMAIKQAELQQERIKFGIQMLSTGIESMRQNALNYYAQTLSTLQLSMEYSKAVIASIIDIYNLEVKVFEVKLEKFKAEAYVYETKVKAALAAVEIFTAQINAQANQIRLNESQLNLARTRIDIYKTIADVYRYRIESAAAKANIQKLKLEQYGEQLRGYQVRVDKYRADIEKFNTNIRAQEADANIDKVKLDVYLGTIEASKARLDAELRKYQIRSQAIKDKIEAAKVKVDAVRSIASVLSDRARVTGEIVNSKASLSKAKLDAVVLAAKVRSEDKASTNSAKIVEYRAKIDAAIKKVDFTIRTQDALVSTNTTLANIVSSSATAAYSSMVSLAQVSASQ